MQGVDQSCKMRALNNASISRQEIRRSILMLPAYRPPAGSGVIDFQVGIGYDLFRKRDDVLGKGRGEKIL